MSKKAILNKRIALVALVMSMIGVVGYVVALFQAYGLVGLGKTTDSAMRSLQIIELVQLLSKTLIICGVVLGVFLLIKRLMSRS